MSDRIPRRQLTFEDFGPILCYPKPERCEFDRRLEELSLLGIDAIRLIGNTKVLGKQVLGKGCVSLVVRAEANQEDIALKVRRVDADRPDMSHEANMLKVANEDGVGPTYRGSTQNLLAMSYIEGLPVRRWLKSLSGRGQKIRIRGVLSTLLGQCAKLDLAGIDHGELSNASKHILVDKLETPWIIDFESSSTSRRPKNLTSIVQFLFINPMIAPLFERKLGLINREQLFALLKTYKRSPTHEGIAEVSKLLGIK